MVFESLSIDLLLENVDPVFIEVPDVGYDEVLLRLA
jgi:hypothetical protein